MAAVKKEPVVKEERDGELAVTEESQELEQGHTVREEAQEPAEDPASDGEGSDGLDFTLWTENLSGTR